jgi:hypothetical protein
MGIVGKPNTWTQRRRKPFSTRPKIVCARCNNGWMSRLEQRAQPIVAPLIRGEASTLDAAAQALTALWVVKTAMTLRWVHRHPDYRGIVPEHYREVFTHQRPPRTAQVFIGACSHDDRPLNRPAVGFRYRMMRIERFEVKTPAGITLPYRPAYGVTLSLGNLAAVVFGHTYEMIRGRLVYDGLLGEALHSIWPDQSELLTWPEPPSLNYTEFDLLIKRMEPWM